MRRVRLLFSSGWGEVCLRQGLSQAKQRIVLPENQSCRPWSFVGSNQTLQSFAYWHLSQPCVRKISIWQTQWKHCWGIRSSANDSFPAVAYRLKSGKKVREKKVTHTHESDWVLHLVALWLGVDSASSLFSRHVQDVLWHRKPYLKVDGRARSSPVRGGSLLLSQRVRVHIVGPTQHIWGFFSPLLLQPAPPEQLMLSSKWTHWPELHRQNIPFCRPPQPRFELHNLPSFLHRQPAVSSLGWGFRRLLLMNSLTLDRCASLRVFGQVVQNTSHYISEPSSFMTLCSGRSSPLPFNFGRSVLSPLRVFISELNAVVEDIWLC